MLAPPIGGGQLDNLITTFVAMDTDGDGTVDFHEFCIGMTGKAKGPFDGLSDYDVNRLIDKFLDYANMIKRERALAYIETPSEGGNDHCKVATFKSLFTPQQKATTMLGEGKQDIEMEFDDEDSEIIRIKRFERLSHLFLLECSLMLRPEFHS